MRIKFHSLVAPTLLTRPLALPTLMARRITCHKCYKEFSAAQYYVHKFTHTRDKFLPRNPVDLPTSNLLPIAVPDDSDEVMEDAFNTPTHSLSPTISDNHENSGNSHPSTNPFSDDHASSSLPLPPPHNTPSASASYTFLPSTPSDEDMDLNLSSHHSVNTPAQGSAPDHSPPLTDEDLGFEDSGLDPAFSGHLSLSEQLKENFLASYHGGGKQHWAKCDCICLPLSVYSEALI